MKINQMKVLIKRVILTSLLLLLSSWSTPTTISGTGINFSPTISVNASSNSVAAWINGSYPNFSIQSASYDGTNWSSFVTLSTSGTCSINPVCSLNASGNAVVIWYTIDSSNRSVYVAEKPAGSAWQTPVILSTSTFNNNASMAMNDSGQIIAAWIDQIGGSVQLVTSTFGSGWSDSINVVTDTSNKSYLEVAIDASGNGIIIWQNIDDYTIYAASTTDGFGSSWSSPVALSTTGMNSGALLSLDQTSGHAIASWFNMDTGDVLAAIYQAGTWNTSTVVLADGVNNPTPVVNGTDYFVSWIDFSSNSAVSRNVSGTWETPAVLSVNTPNDTITNTAIGGVSSSCWTDLQTNQITVADYGTTGSATTPVEISSADAALTPQMASSSTQTFAIWQGLFGADYVIQVNIN